MPGENIPIETKQAASMISVDDKKQSTKRVCNVDDLEGRVCYFSLTGDLALDAFEEIKLSTFKNIQTKRNRLKRELTERLYFAVLMFDVVVMHCSDPLRKEIVLEVLEKNIQWIENGRIVFITSNHINNIQTDFKKYIERKISDYSEGFYSDKEAASLQQNHITEEYYKRVINLLDKSPFLVRKSKNTNNSFDKLVLNDLNQHGQAEQVIIDSSTNLSQILSLNLSLYQLLNIREFTFSRNSSIQCGEYIFPLKKVDAVSEKITEHLRQENKISRSAIVDFLTEDLQEISEKQKNILKAITLRMDVLYCRMNSGKQLILEFHPSFESRSVYQINCFDAYIKSIIKQDKKLSFNSSIINEILGKDSLDSFRSGYLACMADAHEHMKLIRATQENSEDYKEYFLHTFKDVLQNNQIEQFVDKHLSSIKVILEEAI